MLKIQFVFSVFVLLLMHQLVVLESASTNTNFGTNNRTKRAAIKSPRWVTWDGVILYEMRSDVKPHRCLIESAMMHIMLQSCVLFRTKQYGDFRNYYQRKLFIFKGDKCGVFMRNQSNVLSDAILGLNDGCFNFGKILRELMHLLGYQNEHQRSDRDQYLQINYDNIGKYSIPQFNKNEVSSEHRLTEFDIDSITMYRPVSGSVDPELKTIESKVPGKQVLGAEDKLSLSPLDVKSINAVYKCHPGNLARSKLPLLNGYMARCSAEARKYIKLSLIKQFIDQCPGCSG